MTEARRLGGFELHEKLGSGAMATVYRGVQISLGRQVVLKIIHPHLAEDPGLVARFEREARAAAHLRHENIVQVIDCGKIDDTPFIAMEFVQGMDLKRLIETYGVPPLEMTILMLRDICRGLQHAHENGVIHRDIKPANLMITPAGTIKIMDFGLARRAEDSVAMTMAGAVMGTPAYMSPEQATGLKVDERSDLFTVGIVGYELLTGHRPFHGDTYSAVLNAILTQEPEPLPRVLPGVPEDLANLIHRALAKEPSARPSRIADLRDVLETLVVRLGLTRGEDLLRHYAGNPDVVAQRLRERGPRETVESVLLGTVPRPAPSRPVQETRTGLETVAPVSHRPDGPPEEVAPPQAAPADVPPEPVSSVARPPVEPIRPPEAPGSPGLPRESAPPRAVSEPPARPPVQPRGPRAGLPPAALIGGGILVTAVVVALGLQFLKPKPVSKGPQASNGDVVGRPPAEQKPSEQTPGGKPPDPIQAQKPPEKKPTEVKPVVKPIEKPPDRPPDPRPKVLKPPEQLPDRPKAGARRYRISSRPNAEITLDGRKIQFGQVVSLSPGLHRFKAVNAAMNLRGEFTYTVTADDQNNALILNLEENRLVARQVRDLPF